MKKSSAQMTVWAAGLSFLLAVYLWFTGDKEAGIFVGLWVPSLLALANFVSARK